MRQVKVGTASRWCVIRLVSDATGLPASGVIYSQVTVYTDKNGSGKVLKPLQSSDWIDAQNDGEYWLQLNATDLDTIGEVVVTVSATGLSSHRFVVEVAAHTFEDSYQIGQRALGLAGSNRILDSETLDSRGRVTAATFRTFVDAAHTILLATYTVTATYDAYGACVMTVTETLP